MTGDTGTPNAAPTYAETRQSRSDAPAGGNFLSAKNYPNGLDVKVVGVEMRPGYQGQGHDPYWIVEANGVQGPARIKENKPMSDRLDELGIADPTGRSFILTTALIQGNKTWAIARAI